MSGAAAPMLPSLFTGNYTRPDDLVEFDYEVTITPTDDGVGFTWLARVLAAGEFRGRPNGMLKGMRDLDQASIELAVRVLVESAIRDRVGVG